MENEINADYGVKGQERNAWWDFV